ncbi:hypothetical protein COV19_03860 [Candidatus Woesearchaeota archaeon CG10_big_fil_rev_8_21_14_0_10_44_13]|nr:MAG: hypothetical protein COV19_03860 [Candidatus Woesearchaeota archaeon CG10_big_fil_rev_8_21_14_0_10_44_13]
MDRFSQLRKEIREILPKSPIESDLKHSELTHKWLLKLKPDADEAMQIAAITHDIDRAITRITEKDCKDFSKMGEFKKEHGIRSAKFISEIMKKQGYDKKMIDNVRHLVESHESGGDDEQDMIMSADSLAFFEYNLPTYLKHYSRKDAIKKIGFMYKRLPEKARKLVREMKFKDEVIRRLVREGIDGV